MTQKELAEFMAAHPLEVVVAAYALNGLAIVAFLGVVRWLDRLARRRERRGPEEM